MIIHHHTSQKNPPAHISQNSSAFMNPISQTSSVILFGRDDESRYIKEMEERTRVERIKEVRMFEKEASKMSLQKQKEKQAVQKQKDEQDAKLQEYQQKLQEIEELKKMKILEIERTGKAMRDAQLNEERRLNELLESKEKEIRDNKNARVRGGQALAKERQLCEEKKKIEEEIKQIERKKLVQQQESQLAHENANRFREEQEQKSQLSCDQHQSISQISKYGNRVENSIISKSNLSQLDYTNTRFHNALIVRHDHEQVISEELEKQKEAFSQAQDQTTKLNINKAQKENTYRQQQVLAKKRGNEALAKEKSKADQKVYEHEMKLIQKKEGWEKIQDGLKLEKEFGAAQGGVGIDDRKVVVNQQKEKQKKQKLLNEFENEFLIKEDQSKSQIEKDNRVELSKIQVPKPPQQIISNIETTQGSNMQTLDQNFYNNQNPAKISVNFPSVQYSVEQYQPEPLNYGNYNSNTNEQYNNYMMRQQQEQQNSGDQPKQIKFSIRENENQQTEELEDEPYIMPQRISPNQINTVSSIDEKNILASSYNNKEDKTAATAAVGGGVQQVYQNQSHSSTNNFNTLQNPFFVPMPQQFPSLIAPSHNALPQHNPFLEEIKQKEREDDSININIVHPKQQQQQYQDQQWNNQYNQQYPPSTSYQQQQQQQQQQYQQQFQAPQTSQNLVDQFLQENQKFLEGSSNKKLKKSKHDNNDDDSELPSDYGDEESSENNNNDEEEDQEDDDKLQSSSSSCSSAQKSDGSNSFVQSAVKGDTFKQSVSSSQRNEQRIKSTNNIPPSNKNTTEQKVFDYQNRKEDKYQNLDDSPGGISDKYLNSQSQYDQSKMSQQTDSHYIGGGNNTSSLADEFLALSGSKPQKSNQNNYRQSLEESSPDGSSSQDYSGSKMSSSLTSMSYLKSSSHLSAVAGGAGLNIKNSQEQNYFRDNLGNDQKNRTLQNSSSDYNNPYKQSNNYLKQSSKNGQKQSHGALGESAATPMSELSYSYSDMLNEFDGSNYGSSKMRMSNGSQLRQQPYYNAPPTVGTMTLQQSNYLQKNDTIEEESNEENKSSSHYSSDHGKAFKGQNNNDQYNQKKSYDYPKSHQTPNFSNPNNQKVATGGIKIEIGDTSNEGGSSSLADVFRQKKMQILTNHTSEETTKLEIKVPKKEKTKEELAEIRRQMMKRPNTSASTSSNNNNQSKNNMGGGNDNKKVDEHSQLMSRLAKGQKGEVNKKEMLKLTSKNYDLLPEVKKKKEDERKKEELRERMRQVKELEKQRRDIMMRQSKR